MGAELLEQRAALVAARASGHTKVVFHSGGTRREIEYRSVADLQAAIDAIDRDLAAIQGRRPRTFLPSYDKGL
ncbi:MAG: phage head-tail joining protein [Salinarimonas sp.]